jgi:hypothetical protein
VWYRLVCCIKVVLVPGDIYANGTARQRHTLVF